MNQAKKEKKTFMNRAIRFVIILLIGVVVLQYLYENSSLFYTKSFNLPFTMHLNRNDLYLVKGEEFHLYVFAINKRVSFSSTDFRVAGVNFNGRVFAYQTGKAFIIAKVGNKELKCRVHVVDINRDKVTLKIGETYHLKMIGSHAFVNWRISDKEIASVGMFGKVTAKSRGTTTVYGKIKGKTVKCKVIVE